MKPSFRSTSPADGPAVAAFLQRIFSCDPNLPLIAPRNLQWKCWEERSDWPGSRGYVITKADAIAAHATVMPLSYVDGQRRLKMVHLIDWAADPKSVGSGVTLLKQISRLVDAVVVAGGSDMTQKVLPALGFHQCGEVTRFARPLRPLRRLAGQKPDVRLYAQAARGLLWELGAPRVRTRDWTAIPIAPDQLAARLPRTAQGAAFFERTIENISYFLKCPVTPMELYSVAKDGSPRGYFLLAHAPGQTRIVDFHADSEDREHWRILVQLAVSQAKRNPAALEVAAVASEAVTRQALLDCGFHARGEFALRILPGPGIALPSGPVRFHLIDYDGGYRHENRNAYWA